MPSDSDRDQWRRPPQFWDRGNTMSNEWHGPVWHYTSEAGLTGILESSVVWATESGRLNDREEVGFGIAECERIWRIQRNEVIDPSLVPDVDAWLASVAARAARRTAFIVSATCLGDSLNHWGRYAPAEGGFAIAFNREYPFRLIASPRRNPVFIPDDIPAITWRDVEYGERNLEWAWDSHDRTRVLFDTALDMHFNFRRGRSLAPLERMHDALDQQFLSLVFSFKSEPWRQEEEVRTVAFAPPIHGAIKRRTVHGIHTRYVELTAATEEDDDSHYVTDTRRRLPIQAVRIGPRPVVGNVAARVRALLSANGYRNVPVHRSVAQVRFPRSTP